MAYYRTWDESSFKNYGKYRDKKVTYPNEWVSDASVGRLDEPAWVHRYDYEAKLIKSIIDENNYKKIIEFGPGPGKLGQIIIENGIDIEYTFVDKIGAKSVFEDRKYNGKFIVKDLMDFLDISDLDDDYDMVIANDFLEHIANPSDILYKAGKITKDNASFFISVPNWRMGHVFLYRGLFDYDNFIYFCDVHGWKPESVFRSPLKCQSSPKLDSESTMPDELIDSWNWYFNCKRNNDYE